jgi:hypothetical protein
MYLNAVFDAEQLGRYAQGKRRDVTFELAGHRIRCIYSNTRRTVRFMVNQHMVPVESVQQLMNRHRDEYDYQA